uniref:Uncharacterized protein n=1 Tax=Cyanistes caeruleus TaxID=156563 RepID=A0A8C0U3V8_CYACU
MFFYLCGIHCTIKVILGGIFTVLFFITYIFLVITLWNFVLTYLPPAVFAFLSMPVLTSHFARREYRPFGCPTHYSNYKFSHKATSLIKILLKAHFCCAACGANSFLFLLAWGLPFPRLP